MSFFDVIKADEALVSDRLARVRTDFPDATLTATVVDQMVVLEGTADSDAERGAIVAAFRSIEPDLTPCLAGNLRVSDTPVKKSVPLPPDRSVERHSRGTTQRIYRVKVGDTLEQLAIRFYHDPVARRFLASVNGELIGHPDVLSPGWVLLVPESLCYTVRKGDSLESISRRFYRGNLMLETLINNNLELAHHPKWLVPGIKLRIPFL